MTNWKRAFSDTGFNVLRAEIKKYCGIERRVARWKSTVVSDERTAAIFRIEK
jgi:hypothetical protein